MQRILILCTGNSARSQMAEGILRTLGPGLEVYSAGTSPAACVHPAAVWAMAEIGIDISAARPKSVDLFLCEPFDYVLTVCAHARETCPAFLGRVAQRRHLGFDDPAAATGPDETVRAEFRRIRDRMQTDLQNWYARELAFPLRPAAPSDMDAVSALLVRSGLSEAALADQFGPAYAVISHDGEIIAAAGLERHGDYGLLRSVAVAPEWRGRGLAARLVAGRLDFARNAGLRAVYLITTTAEGYFPRAGFHRVERQTAPPPIQQSPQFSHICPSSGIVMRHPLHP